MSQYPRSAASGGMRMVSRASVLAGTLAAVVAGAACTGGGPEEPGVDTPAEAFVALEETLADGGPPVRIGFDVTADGAVSADLTGTLLIGDGGRARVEASGNFAGQLLDVTLISDGDRMYWTGSDEGSATPAALRDALAIGFTRMGILHNLARLSGAAPPDHAEGGVREWVVVTPGELEGLDLEEATEGTSAVLDITVRGEPSGSFALEFDGALPRVRRQVVEFPQGIMRVTERYRVIEIDAEFPAGAFDTTPLDTNR